jgi:hypothetical protein
LLSLPFSISGFSQFLDYTQLWAAAPPVWWIAGKCSAFPDYLHDLLGQHQYLDQLAGVVDLGHPNPDVVARFQQMYDQAPVGHVDKHDLLLGNDNSPEIGGTVLALHQFISPLFLAHYTMDHDACCSYMMDERSSQKKNRKIPVASRRHPPNMASSVRRDYWCLVSVLVPEGIDSELCYEPIGRLRKFQNQGGAWW